MEYLVTMTTHVPEAPQTKPSLTSAPARPRTRLSSRRRDTCCACGVPRCGRANGERSGSSPPTTVTGLRKSSPRCRCACGGPMRSRRSRRTRMTRPAAPATPATGTAGSPEFLTAFTITVPAGTPGQTVDDTEAREAERRRNWPVQGHLLRLWGLPGEGRRWACGEPRTLPRCRRSWRRCPVTPG